MKKIIAFVLAAILCLSVFACSNKEDKGELVIKYATDLEAEDFGIGVKKSDTELLAAINGVIEQWLSDGTMDKYVVYYSDLAGGETAPDADGLQLTWDFGDATEAITMYTESGFAPFEFVCNNEVTGLDVAIMSEVAVKMGCKLEVKDVTFDSIVENVKASTGKAVAAAGMSITEERKEALDFSTPYFNSKLVIVSYEADSFETVADIKDIKVGVQEGTSGDFAISDKSSDADNLVVRYKQYSLALADLQAGRIAAILMDEAPAKAMLAAQG